MTDNKFTAVYGESWLCGSKRVTAIKMKRIEQKENETVIDALKRENIAENTEYLFVGWPLLQGEKSEEVNK